MRRVCAIIVAGAVLCGGAEASTAVSSAGPAAPVVNGTGPTPDSTPSSGLACPPDFLTDVEQRMYAKDGQIRSGPWHVLCYQSGVNIYNGDHIYAFCQKNQTHASTESADGHAIKFQFPPDVACVWQR